MPLIFATNNDHKVQEIRAVLGAGMEVITLREAGIQQDIPEPFLTLEENALHKARTIHGLTGQDCFSEDTGLEVEALGGEPGVHSARYAGESKSFRDNVAKLLRNMEGQTNRNARFRTVIALIRHGREWLFEGVCPGSITSSPRGEGGFGYDPVFVPAGSERSFAEMSLAEKNQYSHRRIATDKLVTFLQTNPDSN